MPKEKSSVIQRSDAEKFSVPEYNHVAHNADLLQINLLSSRFDVSAECLSEEMHWKLKYGRKILSSTYNEEESFVAAIIQFRVEARLGKKRAMICTADYGIYYSIPEDSKKSAALAFCHQVGSFASYPYFRALMSQYSWNAGLSLPPMPSIASTVHKVKNQNNLSNNQENSEINTDN